MLNYFCFVLQMVEGATKNNATSIKEANFFVAGQDQRKDLALNMLENCFFFLF